MVLTLIGNLAQISIWAGLFMLLDQFDDFSTAFYHSCVNFVTLGYGDIVMDERWRLLGPLEGANGILMFGVSTAVMTAAVMDVIKFNMRTRRDRIEQRFESVSVGRVRPARPGVIHDMLLRSSTSTWSESTWINPRRGYSRSTITYMVIDRIAANTMEWNQSRSAFADVL